MNRKAYVTQQVPEVHGQRWAFLQVNMAAMLDQLIFEDIGHRSIFEFPQSASGGDESLEMTLPYDQCGLHLGYLDDMIQSWITFEIKNLTKTWAGDGKARGHFNTGAYVCGLYKFRQVSWVNSNAVRTGDAFMVKFEFFPGEAK
ncbi:unnamed protein product [Symbiodinium sp. CCMP2592]|nr:unnamed protein product [Symbiodinium sp. CCMP2592]